MLMASTVESVPQPTADLRWQSRAVPSSFDRVRIIADRDSRRLSAVHHSAHAAVAPGWMTYVVLVVFGWKYQASM
eukprot:2412199-Prymnesium_polylepis.2